MLDMIIMDECGVYFASTAFLAGLLIFFALELWQLPSHIASAQWWCDRIAMLGNDYVAGAVLAESDPISLDTELA